LPDKSVVNIILPLLLVLFKTKTNQYACEAVD
jgi:hypothetical protein